ncbi:hypothetical protein ACG7TL_006109 [Trametes sanguinea]
MSAPPLCDTSSSGISSSTVAATTSSITTDADSSAGYHRFAELMNQELPDLDKYIDQGKKATLAYAVRIDQECVHEWAKRYWDMHFPGQRATFSSDEEFIHHYDKKMCATILIVTFIGLHVYKVVPSLPHLVRNTVAILRNSGPPVHLFVFKDNSSRECLEEWVEPADVVAVKNYLGVKNRRAKWHNVTGHIGGMHANKMDMGATLTSSRSQVAHCWISPTRPRVRTEWATSQLEA